jgi:hypothetical protein
MEKRATWGSRIHGMRYSKLLIGTAARDGNEELGSPRDLVLVDETPATSKKERNLKTNENFTSEAARYEAEIRETLNNFTSTATEASY